MAKGVIVLDIRAPLNRNPLFPPLGHALESEKRADQITGATPALLNSVGGVIPGHRLEIDTRGGKECKARLIDRMRAPEHKALGAKIKALAASEQGGFQTVTDFYAEESYTVGEADLPSWLYWMRRLVDEKKAFYVAGSDQLPEYDEIRKLGPVTLSEDNGIRVPAGREPFNVLPKIEAVAAAK